MTMSQHVIRLHSTADAPGRPRQMSFPLVFFLILAVSSLLATALAAALWSGGPKPGQEASRAMFRLVRVLDDLIGRGFTLSSTHYAGAASAFALAFTAPSRRDPRNLILAIAIAFLCYLLWSEVAARIAYCRLDAGLTCLGAHLDPERENSAYKDLNHLYSREKVIDVLRALAGGVATFHLLLAGALCGSLFAGIFGDASKEKAPCAACGAVR